jgi:DNA-directed RNA polymerase specialized sigma24 family protein
MGAHALTDEEVVARIQLGETELYQVLAERHARRLYATVRRIIQNPNDVEDVLQQAHPRALKHFGQFEGRPNILTWLTRVTVNEACTYLRRRRDCSYWIVPTGGTRRALKSLRLSKPGRRRE